MGQTKHVSDSLDYSLWRENTENLWDSAILYPKLLAVEKEQAEKLVQKQLPAREGDTRGAGPLRLEASKLRPQVTNDHSNSRCNVPQVRVWLCRVPRKGKTIVSITKLNLEECGGIKAIER